jgi:hypothetical protein
MARSRAQRRSFRHVRVKTSAISYEDKDGHWHDELSAGNNRPETDVTGADRCQELSKIGQKPATTGESGQPRASNNRQDRG